MSGGAVKHDTGLARSAFEFLTTHPRAVLLATLAVIGIASLGAAKLERDPSVDAFIPKDHHSYISNERAKALFGLSDPIVVGLIWPESGDVFTPANLMSIRELHHEIEAVANVRFAGVTSLASESYVDGQPDDAVTVTRYIGNGSVSESAAQAARRGWESMVPHRNTLVSSDASAAAILVELEDTRLADQTYQAIRLLTEKYDTSGVSIHIAGLGAVIGYLSDTISADVRSLVPLIYVVVLITIFLAFRSFKALIIPLPVIVGAVVGSLGLMAHLGIPYFAITSALPVVIVAIAVADTIYILSAYAEVSDSRPQETVRANAVEGMLRIVRPITVTTVTTAVGFAAIAYASIMPPLMYFGWFAALGILLAWLFSVTAVPALIVLLRPRLRSLHRSQRSLGSRVSELIVARPAIVLTIGVLTVGGAGFFAAQVTVDRSLVASFPPSAPIRKADEELNRRFAGTAFLDVMVDTQSSDGLLSTDVMDRIARLQARMENLPRVQKSLSVADYLGQIHRFLGESGQSGRELPRSGDGIAQYLMVYESSSTPDALKEQIDGSYRYALVRGILDTRFSSQEKAAVEQLQAVVDDLFSSGDATATLSGRVNTRYHWMNRLAGSHVLGVSLSVICVFAAATLMLRSGLAATAAMLPVLISVICLYAAMGMSAAHLEPATSMFAAISIGVGVDYAIHLVYRLREALRSGLSLDKAVQESARTTGRACFFNAVALGLGFAVLIASDLMTLKNFGGLIAVAAFASFASAFVWVPLFYRLLPSRARAAGDTSAIMLLVLLGCFLAPDRRLLADETGDDLARRIYERDDGDFTRRTVEMQLVDSNGRARTREARVLRLRDDNHRLALIVFEEPKSIRETSFLNHDDLSSDQDRRWLFLPATGRVRRLPASERGDYFLGTDFTYADVQSELKFELEDYEFSLDGQSTVGGRDCRVLAGIVRSADVARETGYGGFEACVDEATLIPIQTVFTDPSGRKLKTIRVKTVATYGEMSIATELEAVNERTGHRTVLRYRDVEFPAYLDTALFDPTRLRRGILARL